MDHEVAHGFGARRARRQRECAAVHHEALDLDLRRRAGRVAEHLRQGRAGELGRPNQGGGVSREPARLDPAHHRRRGARHDRDVVQRFGLLRALRAALRGALGARALRQPGARLQGAERSSDPQPPCHLRGAERCRSAHHFHSQPVRDRLAQADQLARRLQGAEDPRAGVALADRAAQALRRLAALDAVRRSAAGAAEPHHRRRLGRHHALHRAQVLRHREEHDLPAVALGGNGPAGQPQLHQVARP